MNGTVKADKCSMKRNFKYLAPLSACVLGLAGCGERNISTVPLRQLLPTEVEEFISANKVFPWTQNAVAYKMSTGHVLMFSKDNPSFWFFVNPLDEVKGISVAGEDIKGDGVVESLAISWFRDGELCQFTVMNAPGKASGITLLLNGVAYIDGDRYDGVWDKKMIEKSDGVLDKEIGGGSSNVFYRVEDEWIEASGMHGGRHFIVKDGQKYHVGFQGTNTILQRVEE